ncbi:MAG: Smr/MutS family protein [Bryobacterales bacterium]|nr:Smr/MutS family protein [Bryobacterales bacterium]
MNFTSAGLLEFDALKALLGRFVSSPGGHAELDCIEPSSERAVVEETLAETEEAIAYHTASLQTQTTSRGAAIRLRFDQLPDVQEHVAKLQIGGVPLEGMEIRELLALLDRATEIRAILLAAQDRYPRLAQYANRVAEFRPLLKELSGKIEPDGSLSDHASVALHRIRRDMERQQRSIEQSLERFLRAHRDEGILQDEYVTFRNERYVLPIVAGQRRKVDGIIHAASGTGHTLFIEPLETVGLNNDLVRLREEEMREVYRILAEITDRLRGAASDIALSVKVLAKLELLFAKARFAADFDCVIPRFSPESQPRLAVVRARHPLLADVFRRQRKAVVPLTLTLEPAQRILLISGPNTGGKTVALKTVGLFALMAQSGIPVPADTAELPFFDEVLADIGDQQSIEQSLSSFSAHIVRIREILEQHGPRSLVLLDELGRATDPDEGGALGVAIVDRLRRAGSFALASTHLLAPKIYGASTPGVLNGSMSFDEETLEPTYVLRTGVPGASAGLHIAQRLGLPVDLIEQARSRLSTAQRDLGHFLKLLEDRLGSAARMEAEAGALKQALEQERASLAALWEKREAAKIRELERRTEEVLSQFESRAHQTIDRIAESGEQRKFTEQSLRRVAQTKRELREEIEATVGATQRNPDQPAKPALTEGMRVKLRGVREPARVRRLLHNGALEVEAGFMKLQVDPNDVIEVLPETPASARFSKGISVHMAPREGGSFREINVIGRRADEAVEAVEKFLDSAALASVMQTRIVHGHGKGILKSAIATMLKTHPLVEKFYDAIPQEGGSGATIVELREMG